MFPFGVILARPRAGCFSACFSTYFCYARGQLPKVYYYWPHPLVGVSLASKPLQSWIAGVGIGLSYGEIYAGANVLKTSTLGNGLSTGSPATAEQVTPASGRSWTAHFN